MSWNRPEAVLREVTERFGADSLALAASWQKESSVLVDLVQRIAPGARIFTLDTGALFEETYATWRAIEERYGIEVEAYRGEWIHGLWATDPDRCCSCARSGRSSARSRAPTAGSPASAASSPPPGPTRRKLAWDERAQPVEGNPLADWTDEDVWAYIAEHDLPYNPLHDQGYASIGCTHCTLPGDGREGRWAGLEKTECGLHA